MNERNWIDYLYGEMTEEETRNFEEEIGGNSSAKDELDSFRRVRFLLHQQEDVPPTGNPVVVVKRSAIWSKWMGIAASLLVLLVAGKLLNVQASAGQGSFHLSFGESTPSQEVSPQLLAKLDQQRQEWQTGLASLRYDLDQAVVNLQSKPSDQPRTRFAEYQFVESALHDLQGQNQKMADDLIENLRREQNENTQVLVDNLLRYWDEQRKADLQLVNDGLQNLAESIQLSSDTYAQLIQQPIENY